MHHGELSAARQALIATPPAPGTQTTLAQLQDPARRPLHPYTPIPAESTRFAPKQPLHIPTHKLLTALRRSRKGTTPGPSGLTADTLRIVLDDETTTNLFVYVCQKLAQTQVPANIAETIGLVRIVDPQKPSGGPWAGHWRRVAPSSLTLPGTSVCQPHSHSMQPSPNLLSPPVLAMGQSSMRSPPPQSTSTPAPSFPLTA